MADYIRDLRQAKWGLGVNLHGSIPKRSMSALGQKRTWISTVVMSALCQKRTSERYSMSLSARTTSPAGTV